MRTALVCITDGRQDLFDRGLKALDEYLDGEFAQVVCANDSGDPRYAEWLEHRFDATFAHHPHRQGLAAAIRTAWDLLDPSIDRVVHLEDDICLTRPLNLYSWALPLSVDPLLAQVSLQRAPESPVELDEWGEFIPPGPERHIEISGGVTWTTRSGGFWLQPSVYPRWVVDVGWPEHGGENEFTAKMTARYPGVRYCCLDEPGVDPHYAHLGYCQRSAGWAV